MSEGHREQPWSQQAWNHALPIFNRILAMPYLAELAAGTLPRPKFEFYIQQDALYLQDYGEALAAIARLLVKPDQKALFQHFAEEAVLCEQQLHESFIRAFHIPPQPIKSAACADYTGFLRECTAAGQLEVSLAAILPCFWVYNEVGRHIVAHQTRGANPYQAWIDTYACDAFDAEVRQCIAVCDEHAAAAPALQEAMTAAYDRATEAEFAFWDSAYQLQM